MIDRVRGPLHERLGRARAHPLLEGGKTSGRDMQPALDVRRSQRPRLVEKFQNGVLPAGQIEGQAPKFRPKMPPQAIGENE